MLVGSICTGYGGLEMGLKQVFPQAQLAWVADNDKAASLLLETHYSGVPNLGDIKQVDWSKVEKVDALTAGIPCQPFSDAGKREGHDDDRDLTGAFLEAVRELRPGIVILENVSGFRKRGMGRVLGGLSSMGFDARWHSVRASHAGAPHRRERVFILAYGRGTQFLGCPGGSEDPPYAADNGQQRSWETWRGGLISGPLLLTPTANLGKNGGSQHPDKRRAGGHGPTLADQVEWELASA